MLFRPTWRILSILLALASSGSAQSSTTSSTQVEAISFAEAQRVIQFRSDLPKSFPREAIGSPASWMEYIRTRNAEIKARLRQGDLDSLANLLLFGTSYTKQPLITLPLLEEITTAKAPEEASSWNVYRTRIHDLTLGLASPGQNERLLYMRKLLEEQGLHFRTAADLDEVQKFLATNLVRMLRDDHDFAAALQEARKLDAEEEFKARSHVFERRGISLDTSLLPNLAIEDALKQLKDRKLLQPRGVVHVALVGPGLDVINKDAGFDFYPLQTIQPFALMDSLFRLGLANPEQLTVTTLDISPNVNAHIGLARERAQKGSDYSLQIPLRTDINWTPAAASYWQSFGAQIGQPVPAIKTPDSAGEIKIRAVRIPARQVLRVKPLEVNVVLQHITVPKEAAFDLVVGTNVFVYYNELEQALAEINIAHMLKTNGILLTNDALPEDPQSPLEQIAFSTTLYSDRNEDGDRIVWMRPKRRP